MCIPDHWWFGFLLGTTLMSTMWGIRMHYLMLWQRAHVGSLLQVLRKLERYREVEFSIDDQARIAMALEHFEKTK